MTSVKVPLEDTQWAPSGYAWAGLQAHVAVEVVSRLRGPARAPVAARATARSTLWCMMLLLSCPGDVVVKPCEECLASRQMRVWRRLEDCCLKDEFFTIDPCDHIYTTSTGHVYYARTIRFR